MLPAFQVDRRATESVEDWAERFYRLMAQAGTLRRKDDGSLWICKEGVYPYRIDSSLDDFQGSIHNVCQFETSGKDGSPQIIMLWRDDAKLLMRSLQKLLLPPMRSLVTEPAVLPDGDYYRLTKPGFDALSGVYYWVPPLTEPIEPRPGIEHLTKCFSGVPFEKIEYRNNLIAWLLGAMVLDPKFGDTPLLVIAGNQRGIGKTKTAEASGLLLTGQGQAPVDPSGEEFEKQVGARFSEGQRFIFMDNVVSPTGTYRNSRLARLLTSGFSKKQRILGQSRFVEQQGVLFVLTANDCKLEEDLSTRALPVKLYAEVSQPMDPYVLDYARTHRREIYGELLSLALSRPAMKITTATHPNFRYRVWLEFVYPRVVPLFGRLALEEVQELDDAVVELASWGNDLAEHQTFASDDLLNAVLAARDVYPGLAAKLLASSSTRYRKQFATKFLMRQADKSVSLSRGLILTLRCLRSPSNHDTALFEFEKVTDAAAA